MKNIAIKPVNKKKDNGFSLVRVNSSTASALGVNYVQETLVRYGMAVDSITIYLDENVRENTMELSSQVLKNLRIPTSNSYHIYFDGKEIHLGPFIGIYVGNKESSIRKAMGRMAAYVINYADINGTIFLISGEGIDKSNLTAKGYVYNPLANVWEYTTLPLPAMIFKKSYINKDIRNYLLSIYPGKFFNYQQFDKWEEYLALSKFKESKKFLPNSIVYTSPKSIIKQLKKHKSVYVKPIDGKKGQNILNIVLKNNCFEVREQIEGQPCINVYDNEDELIIFLKGQLSRHKFISQQGLDIKIDGHVIDFRIGFDKNYSGSWEPTVFVGRVGGHESIVSNRSSGGTVIHPDEVLSKYYGFSKRKVKKVKKQLIQAGLQVTKALDKSNMHLGKSALDFGLDKDGEIWLIESNLLSPNDSLENKINNPDKRDYLSFLNMMYSKKIAGFSHENVRFLVNIDSVEDDKSEYAFEITFYGSITEVFKEELSKKFKENGMEHIALTSKDDKRYKVRVTSDKDSLMELIGDTVSDDKTKIRSTFVKNTKK
ncbi:YheC/YheD family endospore coat-associated protein [Alkalibacillus haloalkaliphilus]|uniref:YheC/YheD family endospore coat-associated protein n=1 Tax=Alkalibacillus haloalkaliphilus TaxID=94136 RepID=UPI0029360B83|nr:YheC/YheD family protein [Alkalibacillus haloalkaliphilus]MDV2583322.1 YheC/YheD family protein [Alkalibacillus haloalkaliphilus]